MRILALTLLAVLAVLVACGGDTEPDAAPPADAPLCNPRCDGPMFPLTASWTFFPTLGGPAGPCRAGVANVEVYFETGAMFAFPCTAGHGDAMALHTNGQLVFGRAVDGNGGVVVTSVPRSLDEPKNFTISFYEDAGFVRVFGGMAICALGPGPSPELRAIDATGTAFTKTFDCGVDLDARRGTLISDPLPPGTYDLSIDLRTGTPATWQDVVVGTNNAVADVDLTAP